MSRALEGKPVRPLDAFRSSVPLLVLARKRLSERAAGFRAALSQLRGRWRAVIGAPDYQAYLAHHAAFHRDEPPMSEREYVGVFLEHRYGSRNGGRCC